MRKTLDIDFLYLQAHVPAHIRIYTHMVINTHTHDSSCNEVKDVALILLIYYLVKFRKL